MAALFVAGLLFLSCALGVDEDLPIGEWFARTVLSASIAFICFRFLYKSVRRWEDNNEIPEFTNQCKDYD